MVSTISLNTQAVAQQKLEVSCSAIANPISDRIDVVEHRGSGCLINISPELLKAATERVGEALNQSATAEREYSEAEVRAALIRWISQLAEEAMMDAAFHCASGDRSYAWNRQGFLKALG